MKRWYIVLEFLTVVSCAAVIGSGIGYIQGLVAFREVPRTGAEAFGYACASALVGCVVGALEAPILYYSMLRNSLTLSGAALVVVGCLLFGCVSAFMFGAELGWTSALVTCLVAVGLSAYVLIRGRPGARVL